MNDTMPSINSSELYESFLGSTMAERSFSSRPTTSSSFNKEVPSLSNSDDMLSQFTLPNYVELPNSFHSVDPENLPKKVRGDMDLTGKQLMPFLFKAADKLNAMKDKQTKAEGIKIRLKQLQSLVDEDLLPASTIRSLNHVVDSIEYENYQQAWEAYGRFVQTLPEETSRSWHWPSSIKLLICELKGAQRLGSAGSHLRNQ
ncbi:unnamed protein product [Caenorhabditis nigoni]